MSGKRTLWLRITDGLMLNQLWRQFHTDAKSGYRLYSQEVRSSEPEEGGKRRRIVRTVRQFSWAVFDKFSPARRVVLLVALILLFMNVEFGYVRGWPEVHVLIPGSFWGGLILLVLLVLEVADRVIMKRDLQIAKEIQTWLLPAAPPLVPGLEIAFSTRPANTVAGDYYDVFCRSAHGAAETFLIAIADVAGKSVPAALLMATFQASLKTLSKTSGTLTELVEGMNSYVCGNSQNGRRFITAVLAEYDPQTRTLEYVNCGQNAPMLRRQTGLFERLNTGGIPLGILAEARFESETMTLEPGDLLAFFTDGVTEAEDERTEQFGETRLITALNRYAGIAPMVQLPMLIQDVDRFAGEAPQHDDLTLMLVKAV